MQHKTMDNKHNFSKKTKCSKKSCSEDLLMFSQSELQKFLILLREEEAQRNR